MAIVLPQYYEWHGEMEAICSAVGLHADPDEIFGLYKEMEVYLQALCIEDGCGLRGAECPSIYLRLLAKSNSIKKRLAIIAYARSLEHSHDRYTREFGERLIARLFERLLAYLLAARELVR